MSHMEGDTVTIRIPVLTSGNTVVTEGTPLAARLYRGSGVQVGNDEEMAYQAGVGWQVNVTLPDIGSSGASEKMLVQVEGDINDGAYHRTWETYIDVAARRGGG